LAFVEREPVTVVVSDKGWVRTLEEPCRITAGWGFVSLISGEEPLDCAKRSVPEASTSAIFSMASGDLGPK
jgi:hypothetical protein